MQAQRRESHCPPFDLEGRGAPIYDHICHIHALREEAELIITLAGYLSQSYFFSEVVRKAYRADLYRTWDTPEPK